MEFKNEMQDRLELEGLLFKGFGHIPKFVMLDIDLSIQAKAIYAYFCSYAGSGNSAFPSRDKIVRDFMIGKDTYYTHYNLLLNNGYITARQKRITIEETGECRLGNNIYTLIANPKKFVEAKEVADKHKNKGYARVRNNGMKSLGYGTIPKAIMLDDRIDIKAKGIYAYFCSYAGSGNSAFPKLKDLLYHLQISSNTYYKYFNELIALNYISTEQRVIRGKFAVNDYYLNETPNIDLVVEKPILKNPDTGIKKPILKNPYTENPDIVKPYTENPDTIIKNKKDTNSIYYNQSINQQPAKPDIGKEIDRLSKKELELIIREELLENKEIPYKYTADPRKMEIAIHIITDYYHVMNWFKENEETADELYHALFKVFNEALVEMLTSDKMVLKGAYVTYAKVYDKVSENIVINDGYFHIGDFMQNAINDYRNALEVTDIQNDLQYMKSVIWNSLQVGNLKLAIDIKKYKNFGY